MSGKGRKNLSNIRGQCSRAIPGPSSSISILGPQLAFIPDTRGIVQALEGSVPGLAKDSRGRYVLTTPDGLQVSVIPALSKPADLLDAVPGTRVVVDADGGTRITRPGEKPFVGIPDPFVTSSSLSAGIHRSGEGHTETVTIVYPDGTAQVLKPMMQDSAEFITTVSAIPNVSSVMVKVDGSVEVLFKGQLLLLAPAFDIEPGTGSAGSTSPKIIPLGGGAFSFTNADGDVQLLHLK